MLPASPSTPQQQQQQQQAQQQQISPQTQAFVQCCLQLFSAATPQDQRRQADEWLGQFQLSWEAWDVVSETLNFPPGGVMDERVLFLAAQTLNRKIRYDRAQLGQNEQVWFTLRGVVIGHLMLHSGRAVVATQLVLALVALLVQMETWQGGIQDLVRGLRQTNASILVECLRIIPQEVDDQSLDVSNARRYAFKMEMLDSGQQVIQLLTELRAAGAGGSVVPASLLMDCLASWISQADVEFAALAQSQLLDMCFQVDAVTGGGKELESSVELLIEACYAYHDEPQLMAYVVPSISQRFLPLFTSSSSPSSSSALRNELAKLFSQCCEAFRPHLERQLTSSNNNSSNNNPMVDQLLALAQHVYSAPDYHVARKSMFFWMDLLYALNNNSNNRGRHHREDAVEEEEDALRRRPELLPVLDVVYQASFHRMLGGVDDDDDDGEDEDDEDDDAAKNEDGGGQDVDMLSEVEQHRYETSQVVGHLLGYAGHEFVLQVAEPRVLAMAQQAQQQQLSLPQVEAMLRMFQCSVRYFTSADRILSVLQLALRFSPGAVSLRKITCDIVVELTDQHIATKPDVFLELCLQFVLESLAEPKCQLHASRAMRALCLNTVLAPVLAQILDSTLLAHPHLAASFYSAPSSMRTGARVDLLEGLTRLYVTLTFMTNDGQRAVLQRVVDPIWKQVSNALLAEDVDALVAALNCITIVIRASTGSFDERQVHDVVLSKLWLILPLLTQVQERAVEHVGRLVKHAFRTYTFACRQQGKLIIDFIVKRFRFHPVSGLLYIAGAFFQEYFACEELAGLFPEVLALLAQLSFDLVLTRQEAFVQFPDFVEDLYYLANRTAESSPDVLVVHNNDVSFSRLVGMASEIGVTLEHREAFRSVAVFLENAIAIFGGSGGNGGGGKLRPYIKAALDQHGQALVYNLVNGLCGAQAMERVADDHASNGTIAHVLLALFEFWDARHFEHMLLQCLQQQQHLSQEMRVSFVPSFVKSAMEHGQHQVNTVCQDFANSATRRKLRVVKDK